MFTAVSFLGKSVMHTTIIMRRHDGNQQNIGQREHVFRRLS